MLACTHAPRSLTAVRIAVNASAVRQGSDRYSSLSRVPLPMRSGPVDEMRQPRAPAPGTEQFLMISSLAESIWWAGNLVLVGVDRHHFWVCPPQPPPFPALYKVSRRSDSVYCARIARGPPVAPTVCSPERGTLASAGPSSLALSAACSALTWASISGYHLSPTST